MKIATGSALVGTAFALALLRLNGEKGQLFQAAAHLFVGGLFAAAWTYNKWVRHKKARFPGDSPAAITNWGIELNSIRSSRNWMLGVAFSLSMVELFSFLLGIGK